MRKEFVQEEEEEPPDQEEEEEDMSDYEDEEAEADLMLEQIEAVSTLELFEKFRNFTDNRPEEICEEVQGRMATIYWESMEENQMFSSSHNLDSGDQSKDAALGI